jgi:hypothetical protein
MTIQDLFIEAYEDTNTSTANYPYSKALTKFNEIYSEVRRMIVSTQEDYFWTYRTTNLQEWASEYKVEREETELEDEFWNPVLDEDENPIKVPWIAKVKKVLLKDSDWAYHLIPELSDLEETSGMRGWTLKDNHIFLNRVPTEDIEDWLRIEGIQAINPVSDLTANIEDTIFPWHSDLKQFHNVLKDWLRMELREHKQDFEKADRCKARYEEGLEKMKRYISQRVQAIYFSDVQK